MPFSQLLSKLLDNVNLGKILVDGGPGLLLALSILLLACHSIREDKEDKNSYVPFLKLVVKSEIDGKKKEIKSVEQEAARLAGCLALEDQKLQDITKRIAAAEQGRVHLDAMAMIDCDPAHLAPRGKRWQKVEGGVQISTDQSAGNPPLTSRHTAAK